MAQNEKIVAVTAVSVWWQRKEKVCRWR